MSDLVAVCFKGHDTAGSVLEDLQKMQKEYIVDMEDACWVSRDADGKLKLHQPVHLAGVGAMSETWAARFATRPPGFDREET